VVKQTELTANTMTIAEQSYSQLGGEWADWLEVARRYERKVPSQDRYDMRHTIMLELAKARRRDGKPIPILRAYRIASLMVALYWRQVMRNARIFSLNSSIADDEGNATELIDTVADDEAIDLEAWLDARTWLLGCKLRLVEVAHKRRDGIPLNEKDQRYFTRQRAKELARYQKSLI